MHRGERGVLPGGTPRTDEEGGTISPAREREGGEKPGWNGREKGSPLGRWEPQRTREGGGAPRRGEGRRGGKGGGTGSGREGGEDPSSYAPPFPSLGKRKRSLVERNGRADRARRNHADPSIETHRENERRKGRVEGRGGERTTTSKERPRGSVGGGRTERTDPTGPRTSTHARRRPMGIPRTFGRPRTAAGTMQPSTFLHSTDPWSSVRLLRGTAGGARPADRSHAEPLRCSSICGRGVRS